MVRVRDSEAWIWAGSAPTVKLTVTVSVRRELNHLVSPALMVT